MAGGGRGQRQVFPAAVAAERNPRAELANSRASATELSWREDLGTKDVFFPPRASWAPGQCRPRQTAIKGYLVLPGFCISLCQASPWKVCS